MEDGKGTYLLVSVIMGIAIHLDKRPFEVHVVNDWFPTFLQRVRALADQLGGTSVIDSSFS